MTIPPKEKAKELIEKYLECEIDFPYIDTEDGHCVGTGYMTYKSAVKCALISLDIIINDNPNIYDSYRNQVKEEIKKLKNFR